MIQGVYHQPYGDDNLYRREPTERAPRDPMAGNKVVINASTWPVEMSQTVWITWTKEGVAQPDIGAVWQRSADNTSYWQAELGPFERGDQISYTVHANENQSNEKTVGPFGFAVTSWSHLTKVTGHVDNTTSVDIKVGDSAKSTFRPVVRLAFPTADTLRVQLSPTGGGINATEQPVYRLTDHTDHLTLRTTELVVKITKDPFRLGIYKHDGVTLITQQYDPGQFHNLGWASDGVQQVTRIEDHYEASTDAGFYGFGERYDYFNQYGHDVTTFIYNEYGDQAATDRTYLAVPLFLNSAGYAIYSNSTASTVFNVGTSRPDMVGFIVNTDNGPNSLLDYYVFTGSPKRILDRYTSVTGRPQLPPKWAFGLWLSANEWNNQAQVKGELDAAEQNQIPASVLVLEQWADEATFYIWHGAQYTPKPGGQAFTYSDFTFPVDSAWPDPKAMVADAHARGLRVVLWQIPALKEIFTSPTPHYPSAPPQQHLNDKEYAVQHGLLVGDGNGDPARIALHSWFGNSMIPDFTNPDLVRWWMSKRQYLLDEIKIDGFKCDGGESVFSRSNVFHDGRTGTAMHNAYAGAYIGAYNDWMHKLGVSNVVLSRAGTAGAQTKSVYWAGDQLSSFDAFQAALRAGLSAGASGIPFWTWDLAGFAGPFPGAELYLRSTAMSTFAPIMQLHAQWVMPPNSATRTPWHVQQATGDADVVPIFRRYANIRMNLLPYIYSEAKHAEMHGAPLMRAMNIDFPNDPQTSALDQQYLFGGQMLVAPIATEGATVKEVYVPRGEWWDLWNSAQFAGPRTKLYDVPIDAIPVYAKPGAIIPLNLDDSYELGSAVGNTLSNLNLTFRIYPSGSTQYDYFDDTNGQIATVRAQESWASHQVSVLIPGLSDAPTLQVIGSAPQVVTVDGILLPAYPTLGDLQAVEHGWHWDRTLQATLIKLTVSNAVRLITLNGVDKAAYQAEFALGVGTTTNTNHVGYGGLAFTDGFDSVGDSVTFQVNADAAGDYGLVFRYANANADDATATRDVYVDGVLVGSLPLPPLADWDTWGSAVINVSLTGGPHQVRLAYDADSVTPINLDSLSITLATATTAAVLTQHNNTNRTGANLHEKALTTSTVNPETFGKLFSYPVHGYVFAQPLYLPNVTMPGKGTHNVVYIATMSNWVYAFDADDPLQATLPVWQRHLGPSIPLPDAGIGPTFIDKQKHDTGLPTKPTGERVYQDISREIGVLSTPVISRDHATLYIVAATKDPNDNGTAAYSHHLHALDLATGEEKLGGPLQINASAKGRGYSGEFGEHDNVSNGRIRFVSHRQLQRAGLLLTNDTVYIAFASYGDKDCYHGWVIAYDSATLHQTAVFNVTPSDLPGADADHIGRGGIWQAGAGPAADSSGIYFSTGNGGYADNTDFGDCFIKSDPRDLTVLDWFTPFNQLQLAENDIDLGSSGILLIPGTDLLIGGGKESKFFLMKRDNLGHYNPLAGNGQILQNFYVHVPENPEDPIRSARKYDGTGHHIHGAPAYWHGPQGTWIYIWAEQDAVKAYELLPTGRFQTTPITLKGIPNARLGVPASQGRKNGLAGVTGIPPGMPGGMVSVSANGNAAGTGILWTTQPAANANKDVVPGVVRAIDASDLTNELWNSMAHPTRDELGKYAKFTCPTIANGRVYVATFSDAVAVYGLL